MALIQWQKNPDTLLQCINIQCLKFNGFLFSKIRLDRFTSIGSGLAFSEDEETFKVGLNLVQSGLIQFVCLLPWLQHAACVCQCEAYLAIQGIGEK